MPTMTPQLRRPARLFWPLASILVLSDCATKRMVETGLAEHASRDVVGDVVRFTLAYNQGAAFSTQFGPFERWVLIALALGILFVLARVYRAVAHRGVVPVVALALVAGGAVGNLLDRIRSARGVVDFIDVGVGDTRFWVFNLADVGVSVGAALLVWTLWRMERGADEPAATR
jgi:signal peptidase II